MENEKLPLKSKLAFGGLGAGIGLPSQIAFASITFFYNAVLGLNELVLGIAWLIFSIWNAINDPIFGFIEDHTKSEKYGRRIPYIRFGAPLYGIAFILCWIPFVDINSQIAMFFNFLIVIFIFDTLFTILGLINFTLPAEMALTAKERSNLLVYGTVISSIAYMVAFILPQVLLTEETPQMFVLAMIVVGVISAAILFISSYYLKENKYTQMEDTLPIIQGIKETFKNKPFLIFEVATFSFTIAQTILQTAVLYYGNYILRLGFLNSVPTMMVFLMIFAFLPVYNKSVGKYGVKKTYIYAILIAGLGFLLIVFIGWIFASAIIGFIIVGIGLSGFMLTNQVVIADIVDYDEMRTGKRRETTYSGINALLTKPAISIANWLFLLVIDIFKRGLSIELGIMIGFSLIPAIFLIFGGLVMFKYPLDGPKWLEQKEEMIRIHAEKEKTYLEYLKNKNK
jgi:GPH family glycoside/pentoside/hexuronide:cation symporter